jgi:RHS repeat-associated protein
VQPGTQRFSYSLYDALGRVYEAGELEDDGNAPDRFQDLPATNVNGALLPNVLDPDVLKAWVLNRPRHEVTRTYYDDIFPSLSIPGFTQENLRLRVASTVYYDAWEEGTTPEGDYAHATHYSYDIHGNVKTLVQDHKQLGIDGGAISTGCTGCLPHRYKRMDYTYDLISGNVRQVDYQKDQPDALHHRYTYDADNRITEVETSADAQNWHTDARYFYYPHGPLQRVELGEHLVQGTDYAYTLQGWLKGINSDRLKPENDMGLDGWNDPSNPNLLVGRDAFGFSLNYHGDADYTAINAARWDNTTGERAFAPMGGDMATTWSPLYNGNIAHTVNSLQPFGLWSSPSEQGQVLAQVYQYDQLNRLRASRGYVGLDADNDWAQAGATVAHMYKSTYAYDANGNITQAHRWDQHGDHYDSLYYHYQSSSGRLLRNRLYQLQDLAADNVVTLAADGMEDLPNATTGFTDPTGALGTINTANNYSYDALGNLIRDAREQIGAIEWTVAGKVKSIARTLGSTRKPLMFAYGASGQRTMKQVGVPDGTDAEAYREHYIRDAQGNIMATYRYTNTGAASLKLNERPVYGSSRLGSLRKEVELHTLPSFDPATANPVQMVDLNYEITDHLGNVCAVVTGRLLDGNGGGTAKQAELVSAQGYEPFGALLPGRNYSSDSYRFGFNSMEKDDEMHGNTGNSYDFGARIYDPRVARWLSLDPMAKEYPGIAPNVFVGNSPLLFIDPDGNKIVIHYKDDNGRKRKVVIKHPCDAEILMSHQNNFVRAMATIITKLADAQYDDINNMLESKHKLHVRFEADNTGQFVRAQEDPNGQNTMYFDPQVETEEIALEAVVKLWDIRSRREAAKGNPMMFGTPDLSRFDSEKRSCPK